MFVRLSSFSSRRANNAEKGLASAYDKASFQHSKRWGYICILCTRIAFGSIWAWNAWLLSQCFTTQAASAYVRLMMSASQQSGQHISPWGDFWQHAAIWHPVGFILICVIGTGLVACGLLSGLLSKLTCGVGSVCALFFWSTQLVRLVPGIQAGDTGVMLVFLLAFLGFALITGYSPREQYPHLEREKRENRLPSFAPVSVDTSHGTMPERSRHLAQGASFADIQTQAANESSVPSIRGKEVVGAYTRRFTSPND